jgi:hypothetical protein
MGDVMGDQQGFEDPQQPAKPRGVLFIILVIVAVLFGICVIGGGIMAALMAPALMKAKEKANQTRCQNNMRQIALGALQYADEKRFMPHVPSDPTGAAAIELLFKFNYLDNREVLSCPSAEAPGVDYEGFIVPLKATASSTTMLLWEKKPHVDGKRSIVFVDCNSARVDEGMFQELLAKLKETAAGK